MAHIRITEAQFAMFQRAHSGPAKPRGPRQQKKRADLPENQLEGQILDFLRARGWIVTKIHVGTFVPVGVFIRLLETKGTVVKEDLFRHSVRIGEKGDEDYRAERPIIPVGARASDGPWPHQVFYLEVKRPGKRPEPEQIARMEARRVTGTMAWWVNEFEPDEFESGEARLSHAFLRWYWVVWGAGNARDEGNLTGR